MTKKTSRARAQERREARKKQQQRQRLQVYAVGGILMVVVAIFVIILINQPAEAPIDDAILERYDGIPQSQSEEGFYILGNPAAPVRVVEYSSYSCPACQVFYENAMDDVIEFVRDGIISYMFVPRFVGSFANAGGAAQAAFCAGEQGRYFEMHDALFNWQTAYGNNAFSQNRLVSGAENLGLDGGDFRGCLGSGRADSHMSAADARAGSLGFTGAPITTVNGAPIESTAPSLRNQVLAALGNQQPVPLNPRLQDEESTGPQDEAETTPEALAEEEEPETDATGNETIVASVPLGLQDRYDGLTESRNADGVFTLGDEDAPVVVAEYGSYSCPACFNYHNLTTEYILAQVREGNVQFAYYPHFTGGVSGEFIEEATRAVYCAGEQDAFFPYSAMLYAWHGQFQAEAFVPARLTAGAENLGLDAEAFAACFDGETAAEFVTSARTLIDDNNISVTPTIFIDGEEIDPTLADLEAAVSAALEAE